MEQNAAGLEASATTKGFRYARHRPEQTLLYQLVERYYPELEELMADQGRPLPRYVRREFDEYLKCGRLEYGFLRLRCDICHAERLLAFSCKRRGFCPSCGARRMADSAALLVDEVLPQQPMRQWVLSFHIRCGSCSLANPPSWAKPWALSIAPSPRIGVFAPNAKHRPLVTPGRRGKGRTPGASDDTQDKSPEKCRASIFFVGAKTSGVTLNMFDLF